MSVTTILSNFKEELRARYPGNAGLRALVSDMMTVYQFPDLQLILADAQRGRLPYIPADIPPVIMAGVKAQLLALIPGGPFVAVLCEVFRAQFGV